MGKQYRELSDLGFITGLLTKGFNFASRHVEERNGRKRAVFTFEWNDHMKELQDQWFNGQFEIKDGRGYEMTKRGLRQGINQMLEDERN